MNDLLEARLRALAATPSSDRIANDPVVFVHRYVDPTDQEVAGLLASGLAFGRVALFAPVIATLLDRADRLGGPARWAQELDPDAELAALDGLYYRWIRAPDLVHFLTAVGRLQRAHGTLGALVQPHPEEPDLVPALSRLVRAMREEASLATGRPFAEASRGLRYLLVDPAGGSAAKRLHLFARWMVRSDDVDRGAWGHLDPAGLVMPVDTHVHRIARMVGLTDRRTADLRTAREVTAVLRRLDSVDPVRFDFALAHLGISGGCTGRQEPTICPDCALLPVRQVGSG